MSKIKVVREDLIYRELEVFLNFLNNKIFPQNRNKIFQAFPKLRSDIEKANNTKDKKEIVYQFIFNFYNDNKEKINEIIEESEKLIEAKGEIALKTLSRLMDYEWSNRIIYYAIPTILPFSPFKEISFNFSILGKIYGKDKKDVLYVAIHEISHLVFYDILGKMEIKMENDIKNYFKEALAVVLINQQPLSNILGLKDYTGNPEIQDIFIKEKDDKEIRLIDFIGKYYQTIKIERKERFNTFIKEILNMIIPLSENFSEKRKIWNTYGNKIFEDKNLLKQYRIPIKIRGLEN